MASRSKKEIRRMRRTFKRDAERAVLDTRTFAVRSDSINTEQRTIDAVIASETPVMEMDWNRYEMVPRVLLASGAKFPASRQVPMLDSHNRYSVDSQLGSIRNLQRGETEVTGKLNFSETAQQAWTKVREGHVTDVSAGFRVLKEIYVPEKTTQRIKGRDYTGPVNVATEWQLYEGSITPIGADEAAKMRGLDLSNLPKKELKVKAELRKRCVECGMDASLTDEAAAEWLNENFARLSAPPAPASTRTADAGGATPPVESKLSAEEIARSVSKQVLKEMEDREKLREQARKEQRDAYQRDAEATLKLVFGEAIPEDAKSAVGRCDTMDQLRGIVQEIKNKEAERNKLGPQIEFTGSQRDAHRSVLQTAILVRAFDNRGYGVADKLLPEDKRAKGWEQFRSAPLIEIARECLAADGFSYRELAGLSREAIARAAMGWPHKVGLRNMGYAYHVTGSLAYITLDAINKNLTAGYNEAPSTWRGPMRQAASVPDFKNKHVIKFSAAGNLPGWQDNSLPREVAFSNEKESYAVEARAETASFSWQLLVNDDMDTLSRVPALLGAAASRTVNAVAWAQVTSNPTLSDGQALFLETATGNRKRSNLTTGSAVPSNTTLQTMTNKMMQMRGLNTPEGNESADILNIQPVYIVGPTALRTTILQLVRSAADPAASGNSGVYNPSQGLQPVIEPLLDAATNGTTAWYLFASPAQVDTVEVSFLQGQETPVINDYVDEGTMSRKITVIQSFAAKAIDHRGVQKHNGA